MASWGEVMCAAEARKEQASLRIRISWTSMIGKSQRNPRNPGTPPKLHDIEGCIIFELATILTESENSPASRIRSVEQVF